MVSCKQCSTPNSLDSTFCRRCGTALPAEDVQVAQEKLNALIAEGNTAFNNGKTDEGMAVAESALLSNPSSIPALSLKALCHERKGELALALECADAIVDLNPDSELDRIKRNQLRTKLSVSVQLATQPPDRRTALIGAVATVILVICIGVGLARFTNRPDTEKPIVNNVPEKSTSNVTNPNSVVQPNVGNNTQQVQPNVGQATVPPPRYSNGTDESGGQRPFADGSVLPRTDGSTDAIVLEGKIDNKQAGATPPAPVGNSFKSPTPITPVRPSGGDDPAPTPDKGGIAAQDTSPGMVDIQISGGGRKTFGGSIDTGSDPGGALALDKIGIQRFNLGSFGSAASSFEQALQKGGDQVKLNQWLGRCYDRLGKRPDAIEAYKRCVNACQAAINKGSGNKDQVRAVMDTCQQQLKVLQGN